VTMLQEAIQEIRSNGTTEVVDTSTGEIVESVVSDVTQVTGPVSLDLTGLTIHRDMTPVEFIETGHSILNMAQGVQWAVGDIVNWGEDHLGAIASQLYDAFSEEYIRSACWVARGIPKPERWEGVPFTHHRLVAGSKYSPDERYKLLEWAQTYTPTVEAFSAHIKAESVEGGAEPPAPKVKADLSAALELCKTKEGQTWTVDDTNAMRFWLGL